MLMAQQTRVWTRDDLDRLPDDGNSYEVVRGELFVTPPPSSDHQQVIVVLNRILVGYVSAQGIGDVHQPHSIVTFEGSQVEPDLMVRPSIVPAPRWEQAPVPFLVVEVLSPFTKRRDLVPKRSLYLDAGVAEYWIVDPDRRVIRVVRPDEPDAVAEHSLRWHPSGATEPLVLDVRQLFLDALGPEV